MNYNTVTTKPLTFYANKVMKYVKHVKQKAKWVSRLKGEGLSVGGSFFSWGSMCRSLILHEMTSVSHSLFLLGILKTRL